MIFRNLYLVPFIASPYFYVNYIVNTILFNLNLDELEIKMNSLFL